MARGWRERGARVEVGCCKAGDGAVAVAAAVALVLVLLVAAAVGGRLPGSR